MIGFDWLIKILVVQMASPVLSVNSFTDDMWKQKCILDTMESLHAPCQVWPFSVLGVSDMGVVKIIYFATVLLCIILSRWFPITLNDYIPPHLQVRPARVYVRYTNYCCGCLHLIYNGSAIDTIGDVKKSFAEQYGYVQNELMCHVIGLKTYCEDTQTLGEITSKFLESHQIEVNFYWIGNNTPVYTKDSKPITRKELRRRMPRPSWWKAIQTSIPFGVIMFVVFSLFVSLMATASNCSRLFIK
jgi:hypothetical protein